MNHTATGRIIHTPLDYENARPSTAAQLAQEPAPMTDLMEKTLDSIEAYGRENPWSFGLWMMGVGFVLGWKMKIW